MLKPANLIILAILAIGAMVGISSYNKLVSADLRVDKTVSQWQNQLQRQSDLLPNLMRTVQGFADQEKGVFTGVAEARAAAQSVSKVDPTQIANNEALQRQVIDAQAKIGAAFAKIAAARESYPELKSNRQFEALFAELSGTQNRITNARTDNINAVNDYNQNVRFFPGKVLASLFGFMQKPNFQASEAAQATPTIDFRR